MTGSIDLDLNHLAAVLRILAEHVPDCEVRAFGSRATWTARDYSDLDLAVGGEEPLDWRTLGRLKEAFEESSLPMRVDVLDWHATPESFRKVIEQEYVVVQKGSNQTITGGWHEVALEEIAEIFDGPHATPQKTDSGLVFLGISNLVNGRIDLSTTQHLSEDDYLVWTRRITPMPGDVVFSYETRLGEAAAIPDGLRCCLGRRMGLLRARTDSVDPRFLLYAYLGPRFQETLRAMVVQGSTVDRIPLSEMGAFQIEIPIDVAEQRAIAHVLGTLDDKIELNRRMNQTLEEMARSLFKSWFVDFDPVHAKMEGRWRPGESLPGLPAHLYDLFPNRLVDSELGEIPEAWELRAFGTLLDDVIGGDWGKETPDADHTEPVSIIRGTDLSALAEGGSGSVPLRFTTKKKAERRMLKDGDIIIEVSGGSPTQSTGRSLMMTRDVLRRFPGTVVCASFCRRFRPNSWRDGLLASRHLDFLHSIGKMWEYQLQSTGIANFQTTRFLKEEMAIWPGEPLLTKFAKIVDPIVRQTARNENMILAAQRESLLPKLVSEGVRVRGV